MTPPTYGPKPPRVKDSPRGTVKREVPDPEYDASLSSASMETLELRLQKIQEQLESRRREDTGVYRIKTRELTDELAEAFQKYHESADVVVNAALKNAVKRVAVVVLGIVAAVATGAVTYVRVTPSPETEEVKRTVDDQGSALKENDARQDERIQAVEQKLDDVVEGIGSLGDKLDAAKAALDAEEETPKKRKSSQPKPRSSGPG